MGYAKYKDGITLWYGFKFQFWWDCWFFVGDNVCFEMGYDM